MIGVPPLSRGVKEIFHSRITYYGTIRSVFPYDFWDIPEEKLPCRCVNALRILTHFKQLMLFFLKEIVI